jgi:AraC family transcriptional regulator of adaptative response/methylated-DNA-[protein]-cysteine methyltransferase
MAKHFDRNIRIAPATGAAYHEPMSTQTTIAMQPSANPSTTPASDTELRWRAVLEHDSTQDGAFFYAVTSTRVYCRPSCASRRPRRQNVLFFDRFDDAERAGFRPCQRCRPRSATQNGRSELVKSVCCYIEQHLEEPITLTQLGRAFGRSRFHLQRTFKSVLGITPRQYAETCRMRTFKSKLQSGESVTTAIYDAGFSSSSRVYERSTSQLGMTPDRYRRGAIGTLISFTTCSTPVGRALVAATEHGLCAVRFGSSDHDLEHGLRREFPFAVRRRDDARLAPYKHALLGCFEGKPLPSDLPFDIRATAFQRRVWSYLQSIPCGETRSYRQVAEAVGQPLASRAVARACATSPVALAIPCHRVVCGTGEPGGYRWGMERKRKLLRLEKAGLTSGARTSR